MAYTMEEIRDLVLENGGVQSFSMETIRDAYGAGRLGVIVRSHIKQELRGLGLETWPTTPPQSQHAILRVFQQGSLVAQLIDAVQSPGREGDQLLRDLTQGDSATDTLNKIRELLDE